MKKELRKKILYLIYELEQLRINGADTDRAITDAFEMLEILIDEQTYAAVLDMWMNRAAAADVDSLTLGIMKFDREARLLLIEKKFL